MTAVQPETFQPRPPPRPEIITERERRARVLEASALELDVRGWTQGTREREDGSVCMIQATCYALADRDWHHASSLAKWLIAGSSLSLLPIEFNDFEATSADEVKFVLRWRAAEIRDGR